MKFGIWPCRDAGVFHQHNPYIIEEHLEVVKRRSLIVSLVIVLGVCPVCPAAAVCILSVLPTRVTLQHVGINTPLQTAEALLNPFSQNFRKNFNL